jgi:hypothetical protein
MTTSSNARTGMWRQVDHAEPSAGANARDRELLGAALLAGVQHGEVLGRDEAGSGHRGRDQGTDGVADRLEIVDELHGAGLRIRIGKIIPNAEYLYIKGDFHFSGRVLAPALSSLLVQYVLEFHFTSVFGSRTTNSKRYTNKLKMSKISNLSESHILDIKTRFLDEMLQQFNQISIFEDTVSGTEFQNRIRIGKFPKL